MGQLQELLDREFQKTPQLLVEDFISRKLDSVGVTISDDDKERLVKHILTGSEEPFQWDDGNIEDVTFEITPRDLKEFDRRVRRFIKNYPELIQTVAESAARTLLKTLKRSWREEGRLQTADHAGFRERLEQRYRKPLKLLRMLLTISREFGSEAFMSSPKPRRRKYLRDVLLRLHVRACQVTWEIITLLENGFADGAMARWRTLHEIGVVATFIADAGEPTATRYVTHQAVEAKLALEEYERCYEGIGYRPMPAATAAKIMRKYDAVVKKYGAAFATPYGWAAHHLGNKRPSFGDLEMAIDRSEMRSHYKLASYNVHAGPHGAYYRLGLLDGTSGLLVGVSNAGLVEPGQNTAHTLTQISALLLGEKRNFDQIVALRMMIELRNEIPNAFTKADRKLRRDDASPPLE